MLSRIIWFLLREFFNFFLESGFGFIQIHKIFFIYGAIDSIAREKIMSYWKQVFHDTLSADALGTCINRNMVSMSHHQQRIKLWRVLMIDLNQNTDEQILTQILHKQ